MYFLLRALVLEMAVQQASKVGMQTFVSADELVRERQATHETTLLEPEDRSKRAREEDALHTGESNQPYPEGHVVGDVLHRPIGLLLDTRNVFHSLEQKVLLLLVLHIRLDQEAVGLGVNLLNHRLECVKSTRFSNLHFRGELRDEVLSHNAVG